ncbi:MAG: hypothetical protein PHU06_06415 [Gallionella sp.]|nr:hypothetical protein [Gallionella sp.]MDD4958145.1 hypothetical protein [Gallionella sp.]
MLNKRDLRPYPGLRAFGRAESRIFFGRQQQTDELLTRLKQRHFLAVLGSSGSGKSSLMKAGVLPSLEKGYMGEVGSRWSIAEMKPGDQPFMRLAEALLSDKAFRQAWLTDLSSNHGDVCELNQDDANQASLAASLRRGSRSLHEILAQSPLPEGTRLLLLVDQFEELFRFREQAENLATSFVALILEASRHPDIYVAMTMRSDFLGAAAEFYGLPEAINDGLYLTPRLTREQLREAICLPAVLFRGAVDDALANNLLNEASNNPDQLPLLQHALMRLWDEDEDKILTLDKFQAMNGLRGALDGHAEQAWSDLNPEAQRVAENMFRALTERSRDGQDIRRPLRLRVLQEITATDWITLCQVIEVFRQAGRHFLMPPPKVALNPDTILDISHESLIRQWQRLQRWVAEEGEKSAMYLRLLDAAQRHASGHGELWHGTDLALALEWQGETRPNGVWAERYGTAVDFGLVVDFVSQSDAAEAHHKMIEEATQRAEIRQERQQKMVGFMLIGFVVALSLAVWGFSERNSAKYGAKKAFLSERKAIDSERKALESEKKAQEEALNALNAAKNAKEATAQALTASQLAKKDAQRAMKAESFAKVLASEALSAAAEAEAASKRASDAELVAKLQVENAKLAAVRAQVAESKANQAEVELVKFKFTHLLQDKQDITKEVHDVLEGGQKAFLFAWVSGLIDSSDTLDAQSKKDWHIHLTTLSENHLVQLIYLLFAEQGVHKPGAQTFAALAQTVHAAGQ